MSTKLVVVESDTPYLAMEITCSKTGMDANIIYSLLHYITSNFNFCCFNKLINSYIFEKDQLICMLWYHKKSLNTIDTRDIGTLHIGDRLQHQQVSEYRSWPIGTTLSKYWKLFASRPWVKCAWVEAINGDFPLVVSCTLLFCLVGCFRHQLESSHTSLRPFTLWLVTSNNYTKGLGLFKFSKSLPNCNI